MKTLIAREIEAFKARKEENEFWKTHQWASIEQSRKFLDRPKALSETIWWHIRYYPRNKKYEIERYVRHKWWMLTKEYAFDDFWSFDYSFAKDMDRKFTYMADHQAGYPNEFSDNPAPWEDAPEGFFIGGGPEAWRNVLLEIRDGFRAYHIWQDRNWNGDTSPEFHEMEYDDVMAKLKNSFDLMYRWYPALWD